MADIEQGLKEAVAQAAGRRSVAQLDTVDRYRATGEYYADVGREHVSDERRPSAAMVFQMIEIIGGRVREVEEHAAELAGMLAGGVSADKSSMPEASQAVTLFDRLGAELLTLGHAIDRIDRDVLRALETLR